VTKSPRRRLRPLAAELQRAYPELEDPAAHVSEHGVLVDGQRVDNPRSLVPEGAHIELRVEAPLRGEAKLHAALSAFDVAVAGRIAVDVGAAAGGFTRVLLEAGAARVYAVDAGFGQLLGSLRQDQRVVDLERINLGELDEERVPELVDVITMDLSYLSVADAVPQLESLRIAESADLIALVKPMFELALPMPPETEPELAEAVDRARSALEAGRWNVRGSTRSPVPGARGSVEFLVHAGRRP
jgi:23S rRNA (cytidine1920-2'-O)/16S rRNA (cytidine1409-2'-O)-methyltransferase